MLLPYTRIHACLEESRIHNNASGHPGKEVQLDVQ
jgi:hypothetical protein